MRAHWRLLLATGLGVLLAATLLAAVPIYTAAMTDLGLRYRIERGLQDPAERVVYLEIDGSLLGDPVDTHRREALNQVTRERIGWLGAEQLAEDRSQRVQVTVGAADPSGTVPVRDAVTWPAYIEAVVGLEAHVEVIAGRLPAVGPNAEVVLPDGYQRHARLGDQVRIALQPLDDCIRVPGSEDPAIAAIEVRCRPTLSAVPGGIATVVGFVRQREPDDLRWRFFDTSWRAPETPDPRTNIPGAGSLVLLTTPEQMRGPFAQRLPELRVRHRAGLVPDVQALRVSDVPAAIADIEAWKTDVRSTLGLLAPGLLEFGAQITRFRDVQTYSRVPLLVMLLQVVGVIAFYVVLVASMLADRQAGELSVYRSRGASTGQLVGLALLEGVLLALPAVAAGPWLAARVVAVLGLTPLFAPSTGGRALPTAVDVDAYALAVAGALLSVVAMVVPSWLGARRGVIDERRERARPRGRGFVQRYYLDVAVVLLAALQFWQLTRRGSVFDSRSVGGWSGDPLLLSFPLVLTLAVAAVVLRLYAPLLRLVVRLVQPLRGVAVAMGLQQTARSPSTHARLLMLLVMAASVATFAASYGPTVGTSLRERAEYDAGVDLRATIQRPGSELAQQIEAVRALPGVADAMAVYRGAVRGARGAQFTILGVDDLGRAPSMLWWRDDFASEPLATLLEPARPAADPGVGIAIPDGARTLELQAYLDLETSLQGLAVRVRDAAGGYHDLAYLEVPPRSWTELRASLPPVADAPRPLTLAGFRLRDDSFVRREGSLFMDDLVVRDAAGRATVLDDFEGPAGWTIYSQSAAAETYERAGQRARPGRSGRWSWDTSFATRESVLAAPDAAGPLAAVFGTRALESLGARRGDVTVIVLENGLRVPVQIVAAADYFPTLDPEGGFLVLDRRAAGAAAGVAGVRVGAYATELWVRFDAMLSLDQQRAVVARLTDGATSPLPIKDPVHRGGSVDAVMSDPTLVASGSGILLVAAAAVLALAAAGFVIIAVMAIGLRSTEFAVLRALGVTGAQLLRSLLLEWGALALVGVVLGVVLGRRLASVMLSSINVTAEGARVVPPFTMQSDWWVVGGGLAVVTALAMASLVLAWRAVAHGSGTEALRRTQ